MPFKRVPKDRSSRAAVQTNHLVSELKPRQYGDPASYYWPSTGYPYDGRVTFFGHNSLAPLQTTSLATTSGDFRLQEISPTSKFWAEITESLPYTVTLAWVREFFKKHFNKHITDDKHLLSEYFPPNFFHHKGTTNNYTSFIPYEGFVGMEIVVRHKPTDYTGNVGANAYLGNTAFDVQESLLTQDYRLSGPQIDQYIGAHYATIFKAGLVPWHPSDVTPQISLHQYYKTVREFVWEIAQVFSFMTGNIYVSGQAVGMPHGETAAVPEITGYHKHYPSNTFFYLSPTHNAFEINDNRWTFQPVNRIIPTEQISLHGVRLVNIEVDDIIYDKDGAVVDLVSGFKSKISEIIPIWNNVVSAAEKSTLKFMNVTGADLPTTNPGAIDPHSILNIDNNPIKLTVLRSGRIPRTKAEQQRAQITGHTGTGSTSNPQYVYNVTSVNATFGDDVIDREIAYFTSKDINLDGFFHPFSAVGGKGLFKRRSFLNTNGTMDEVTMSRTPHMNELDAGPKSYMTTTLHPGASKSFNNNFYFHGPIYKFFKTCLVRGSYQTMAKRPLSNETTALNSHLVAHQDLRQLMTTGTCMSFFFERAASHNKNELAPSIDADLWQMRSATIYIPKYAPGLKHIRSNKYFYSTRDPIGTNTGPGTNTIAPDGENPTSADQGDFVGNDTNPNDPNTMNES